jgi:uncharacterized protein YjbI with pentapeptide repeats
MHSESLAFGVILLLREGPRWVARIDGIIQEEWPTSESLRDVLLAARNAVGGRHFTLKVKGGTKLTGSEVLTIAHSPGASLGVDFSGCRMPNIDLNFETHEFVNDPPFRGADLMHVDFRNVDLHGAQLQEAWLKQLERADLAGARLDGVYLENANLKHANLEGAVLRGAQINRAKLHNANLSRCQLQGANLTEAELQGADLRDAQLQGAQPEGVRLLSVEPIRCAWQAGSGLVEYRRSRPDANCSPIKLLL